MKNLLKSLMLLSAVASMSSHAALEQSVCGQRLKLSADQKSELKKLSAEAEAKLKVVKPELKKAKAELKKVLLASNATKEEAVAASAVVDEKQDLIKAVKAEKKLAVQFDVLSAEQRIQLLKCQARKPQVSRRNSRHQRGPVVVHRPSHRNPRVGHGRVIVVRPLPRHPAPRRHPVPHHSPRRPGRVHPMI